MKKLIGRQLAFILVAGFCLALVSCTPKAENQILGKWAEGTNMVITFAKDGKMTSVERGNSETADYWVTNGNQLCVKVKGEPVTVQLSMEFPSANEMVLTMQGPAGLPKAAVPPAKLESKRFSRVSN